MDDRQEHQLPDAASGAAAGMAKPMRRRPKTPKYGEDEKNRRRSGYHEIRAEALCHRDLIKDIERQYPNDVVKQVAVLIGRVDLRAATGRERQASHKTRRDYGERLQTIIGDLRDLGCKPQNISNLSQRHVRMLVRKWADERKSLAYIRNLLTPLRRVLVWVGKVEAVPPLNDLLDEVGIAMSADDPEPKSLTAAGINKEALYRHIGTQCLVTELHCRLMEAFGMRVEEVLMLKPHQAHSEDTLFITDGTKGGRSRVVPVQWDEQRDLLEKAKLFASINPDHFVSATSGWRRRLAAAKKHLYRVMDRCGITRSKLGITPHSFRHEYANRLYREITGYDSPLEGGGKGCPDKELDRKAREIIAERMGHNRKRASNPYIGRERDSRMQRKRMELLVQAFSEQRELGRLVRAAGIRRLVVLGPAAAGNPWGIRIKAAYFADEPLSHESFSRIAFAARASLLTELQLVPATDELLAHESVLEVV